jgi:hypothetical protein
MSNWNRINHGLIRSSKNYGIKGAGYTVIAAEYKLKEWRKPEYKT